MLQDHGRGAGLEKAAVEIAIAGIGEDHDGGPGLPTQLGEAIKSASQRGHHIGNDHVDQFAARKLRCYVEGSRGPRYDHPGPFTLDELPQSPELWLVLVHEHDSYGPR